MCNLRINKISVQILLKIIKFDKYNIIIYLLHKHTYMTANNNYTYLTI